jgi:RNA polymerase sigma-70 factor (sigma-E family)
MAVVGEHVVSERVEAFEDFFHHHYERLLRAMYLATGDRHEAEDLAQDAFVRVYERWERVRGTDNPAGYLYRIALNSRRTRIRRMAVAARKVLHVAPEPGPEHQEVTDQRDLVRRALGALPDAQRDAVVLVEWLGMTDAEAGEVLGVSAGAVRTRLHRARTTLRDLLRGEMDA